MPWQTSLSSDSQIVQVLCSDHITADDLTMFTIETAFQIRQHNVNHVLIDLSKARVGFPASDIQELLDIYIEYRVPKTTRSAIVLPDKRSREDMSELLPVLEEYGYQLMLFSKDAEASKWLRS